MTKATLKSLRVWYDQCERAIESANDSAERDNSSDAQREKAEERAAIWEELQQAIDNAINELESLNES